MAPQTDVSVDAVRAAVNLLDDPFVRELMGGVGVHTESLHRAMRDASVHATEGHVLTLSRVLTATKSGLFASAKDAEEDADEEILRAALELVLDDAATLLEQSLTGVERDAVQH